MRRLVKDIVEKKIIISSIEDAKYVGN